MVNFVVDWKRSNSTKLPVEFMYCYCLSERSDLSSSMHKPLTTATTFCWMHPQCKSNEVQGSERIGLETHPC